ncbi:hypothetical protein CHI07_16925 [Paenibacillus sp. 7884-2]|nr:hypothetical protein CHI07_16925 [Paenibacillus sp. 7884-2]
MQHPIIDRIESTGYPYSAKRGIISKDPFGNDVLPGDEMLVLDDDFYLVEELSGDAVEILERHGATYKIAK